jgi:peroxiredoxin
MSGESLDGVASNPKKGLELSARSIALMEKEIENPVSKPVSTSMKKYKNNLHFGRAMYADTYALLLYKNGDYANALKYQTIACEKYKFKDGEMAERYAVFFEKMNSPKDTEQMLTSLITDGKATSKMLEQHKRLFLANNTVESAYDKYMVSLEKEAKVKKREEIEKKILEEKAPAFTLRNLKGEEVSLEGLRGKVLVLDFWATWCGPCKASFPGMQTAVNKFADRKDVEFLFIDTWENVEDKAKAAGEFIASKSYTFNVLMDLDNQVVTKFGVSGIPTKFVVDRNGKIRFKAVGFNGNDQELVDELSIMIEIAGGEVTP